MQAARLRDGSRRITHITEVMGMEGDVIITQDIFVYDMLGEDAQRQPDRPAPLDRHRPAAFWDRARYYGEEKRLAAALDAAEAARTGAELTRSRDMQTLAMFFLVTVAIGGVVWVFVYPILSGERQAERRKESVARSRPVARRAPRAQPAEVAPRAGRGNAQGPRGARRSKVRAAATAHRAGGADLVEAAVHTHQRGAGPRRRSCVFS